MSLSKDERQSITKVTFSLHIKLAIDEDYRAGNMDGGKREKESERKREGGK
jgi:hypothetical protein